MSIELPPGEIPLGLLELDSEGTVLYYKAERGEGRAAGRPDIVGRNFFTDVLHATDGKDLQVHLDDFWRGREPARSFDFILTSGRASLPVRVRLARTREQSGDGDRESVLVHVIRLDAKRRALEGAARSGREG
jgi:hypothetical protein